MTYVIGHETSRVRATIYSNSDEPGIRPRSVLELDGAATAWGGALTNNPTIVSLTTAKVMGSPSGVFSIDLKSREDLRESIADDDWVDIVMYRFGKPVHVMRGLVDSVRRLRTAGAGGATNVVYRVSGRDFGKIFEQTQMYYDYVSFANLLPAIGARIFEAHSRFANGGVADTVFAFMDGLIKPSVQIGAGYWLMPESMPGLNKLSRSFVDNVVYFSRDFSNIPPRASCYNPNYITTSSYANAWALGSEWADLNLCELFVDLVRQEATDTFRGPIRKSYFDNLEESTPESTRMAVILRDRPFPSPTRDARPLTENSPYFRLPLYKLYPGEIIEMDTGRHGSDRSNAFALTPTQLSDTTAGAAAAAIPKIHRTDLQRHGLRMRHIETRYLPGLPPSGVDSVSATISAISPSIAALFQGLSLIDSTYAYRNIYRDFHCMNHRLYTGSISLNHGRPDIRIGGRVRILGDTEEQDETYYVESVAHSWSYESGLKTGLQVSRGWVGSDAQLASTLLTITNQYTTDAEVIRPAGVPVEGANIADARMEEVVA